MASSVDKYRKLLATLNTKEQIFVQEYLVDGNASRAARVAGYTSEYPGQLGWENLKKVDVSAAVKAGKALMVERLDASTDKVLRELAAVAFASAYHYEAAADGSLQVTEGAPADAGFALQIRHRRYKKEDGTFETETTYQQQDKLKALEMLGKKLKLWEGEKQKDDEQTANNYFLTLVQIIQKQGLTSTRGREKFHSDAEDIDITPAVKNGKSNGHNGQTE